jgi:hypothetical protein
MNDVTDLISWWTDRATAAGSARPAAEPTTEATCVEERGPRTADVATSAV